MTPAQFGLIMINFVDVACGAVFLPINLCEYPKKRKENNHINI